jgi:HEAT repeat protein/beta-lactamase regulating signal transducer with metallopeptidase domain
MRISEFIVNYVLNSAWQIPVIFVVALLASWLLRNGPARYRHCLWILVLIASLVVPSLTATRFVPSFVSGFEAIVPLPAVRTDATQSLSDLDDLTFDHLAPSHRQTVQLWPRDILLLTLVYAVFFCGRGIRLARFWRRQRKLRQSVTEFGLPPEIETAARRARSLLKTDAVAIGLSKQARVPATIGALRPLIILPDAFCAGADEAGLLSVIGHELAHVKRRDFFSNLICEFVALPIAFHPLVFLIKRQVDRARELACDELVTTHVLAPNLYARSLLWAADMSREYASDAFVLSIFDGRILEERIVRVMRSNLPLGTGPARVLLFAALAVLGVSALSLSLFSLELQTRTRAAVTERLQSLAPSAVQEPAPAIPSLQPQAEQNSAVADQRATSACDTAKRRDTSAIPTLIALLGDDSKSQLIKCWDTTRWSPALQTFKHPSPGEQAALALASFGRPAFGPLSEQLSSANATVRRNAAWAIGELTNMVPGERAGAVPQLITLLGDSDPWVRMAAARALGEVRDDSALTRLVATLSDDNWRVRELAVWALSEMKDERAVNALCSVLLSDARVEVRRGAAEALGEIASADALPSLKQALNDTEPSVSSKAAWAISEIEG